MFNWPGTVFCSLSHLLCQFLSSDLARRHTSSNSVTCNYCCRAREVTLSFMDMLIALLLSYFRLSFTYVSLMRRLETAEEYM